MLEEPSQAAVIAIANSAQAVHVLDVHPGADKPAALGALAAAAHAHQRRILALPATETAADYAHTHRYADTTTAAPTGCEHLQAGRWQLPTGSLVVVDDADHLPAAQLAWLTEHAAATNTKLLLLTNRAPEPHPRPHPDRRRRHPPALGSTPGHPRPRTPRHADRHRPRRHPPGDGHRR